MVAAATACSKVEVVRPMSQPAPGAVDFAVVAAAGSRLRNSAFPCNKFVTEAFYISHGNVLSVWKLKRTSPRN